MPEWNPVVSYEPITKAQLKMIASFLGFGGLVARIGEADPSKGAGVINAHTKCLWTKDGRRITINYQGGATIASCSREVDPEAPNVEVEA